VREAIDTFQPMQDQFRKMATVLDLSINL
jgi:hypothetical protein